MPAIKKINRLAPTTAHRGLKDGVKGVVPVFRPPDVATTFDPKRIKVVPLSILKHHPENVRTHSEANIQAVIKSLTSFGQQSPLVVDKHNQVIVGNGRLQAMKRIGYRSVAIYATDLDGNAAKAYAIADNKTSDLSEFDFKKLSAQLAELKAADIDLTSTGFDKFETDPLLDASWDAQKAAAAARASTEKTFKIPGDAWEQIAPHFERFKTQTKIDTDLDALLLVLRGRFGVK